MSGTLISASESPVGKLPQAASQSVQYRNSFPVSSAFKNIKPLPQPTGQESQGAKYSIQPPVSCSPHQGTFLPPTPQSPSYTI